MLLAFFHFYAFLNWIICIDIFRSVGFYCVETGISRSFRELKRKALRLPYYVGEIE